MQGMQSKESGDKGALPEGSRHPVKEPEQQQGAEDMKDDVGDMVSSGMKTIKLIIGHQGQPGQRMPEFCVGGRQCPADARQSDAGLDMMVVGNINIIIKIDEVKLSHLTINSQ